MTTVVLIYKTGGDYTPLDVARLARALRRNLTVPYKIVCMTDDAPAILRTATVDGIITLNHDLPGWWSKLELFKVHGPVLYIDLDTVIVGNIDVLALIIAEFGPKDLLMLRGFYKQDQCSGIMGWNANMHWIFDKFAKHRSEFIQRAMRWDNKMYRGDQEWLSAVVTPRLNVSMAQDVQPGIISYKVDVKSQDRINSCLPEDASIVCFHGKPRPHEVKPVPKWMEQHWSPA